MPGTFQALAVVLIGLLPGGLFIWATERLVGRYGIDFSDRLLRFVGVSALLHVIAAPATYHIWRTYLRPDAQPPDASLPLWLWPVAGLYVGLPIVLGTLIGLGLRKWDLPAVVAGSNPAPTAWDHVLSTNPDGWIRMKLKSGAWIGGAYAEDSYAGGYPEPADIFVSEAVEIDSATGEFAKDRRGRPLLKGCGFIVRWAEVEYLEFAPR